MTQRVFLIVVVLNVLATIGSIIWALFSVTFAAQLLLIDTNLEAAQSLPKEQWNGIAYRSQNSLETTTIPLLVTNVLWLFMIYFRWCNPEVFKAKDSKPKLNGSLQ